MTDEERAEDVAGAKRVKMAKQAKNAASMSGGHKFAPDSAALERFGTLVPWSEMVGQAAYTAVFHMLLQQPGMLFVIASTDGIVPADNTKEHVMREVPGGPQTVRRVVYLESVNQPWVGEALFDQLHQRDRLPPEVAPLPRPQPRRAHLGQEHASRSVSSGGAQVRGLEEADGRGARLFPSLRRAKA
jgi:hypothetical protein